MAWQEQKTEDVKWWDIVLLGPPVFGPSHMVENNAIVDQEIHDWLYGNNHNKGYRKVTTARLQAGLPVYGFKTFVRFYVCTQALHFAMVCI
jgi:hypothetical protein